MPLEAMASPGTSNVMGVDGEGHITNGTPSVPPGFVSLKSFTLQRLQEDGTDAVLSSHTSQNRKDIDCGFIDNEKWKRSLHRRPWVNYDLSNDSSGEESDSESLSQSMISVSCLPKGVLRGCKACQSCQKVMARWHPENACRPIIDEAPVFYPTEEEFEDTLKYISSISPRAESYGICRIVPPPSWRPPCPLKQRSVWENSKFPTRIQQVDKLQNRDSQNPVCRNYSAMKRKRQKLFEEVSNNTQTNENYVAVDKHGRYGNTERFGFESGPEFTLQSFQKYADDFLEQYFQSGDKDICLDPKQWKPSLENIEGEYWRIVERPTEEIEVLYGADLDTNLFGTGFPKRFSYSEASELNDQYATSGWNLNNLSRIPGCLLSYENGDIPGVLMPWLYIGMCFSSFCWHVEDHHLYSLNYLHWGAPKIWYGVPGRDALKLEEAMKKHLSDLFQEQPDLLHNLVTQFSPTILKLEGVPVYRCVQSSGEFVLTFPRAYHSGFSCGFNCAEAVNVAPLDWLPHGENAIELYRQQRRKISLSHDKLLLRAAREAVKGQWNILFLGKNTADDIRWKDACGFDGILVKTLKARVALHRMGRQYLCCPSQSRKMRDWFNVNIDRECVVCHYDLHLSAVGCPCSPDRYTCLIHAEQLCRCSWSRKFFLFHYEISELNMLVDALGGKLSAVHRWGISDLGLSLHSEVNRDKGEEAKPASKISSERTDGTKNGLVREGFLTSTGADGNLLANSCSAQPSLSEKVCPAQASLCEEPISRVNSSFSSDSSSCKVAFHSLSQKQADFALKDVILLSDDEDERMHEVLSHDTKEDPIIEKPEAFPTVPEFDDDVGSSSSEKDKVRVPKSSAPEICENDSDVLLTYLTKPTGLQNEESTMEPSAINAGNCNSKDSGVQSLQSQLAGIQNMNCDCNNGKNGSESDSDLEGGNKSKRSSTCCPLSTLIRSNCLSKGCRTNKVGLTVNCDVEPLKYGVVFSGKLWSTNEAIFPKGYRSRVQYLSILDPSQTCYYISEILDAGLLGPLFMVTVEQYPSEVFIHATASRCWDMVRERVNLEISKQQNMGRTNMPSLQPPESIDGLKMFGLSLPAIIQRIEAMDRDHVCTQYWRSRSKTFPLSTSAASSNGQESSDDPSLRGGGADALLRGLLKKANPDELNVLLDLFSRESSGSKQKAVRLLIMEIQSRRG